MRTSGEKEVLQPQITGLCHTQRLLLFCGMVVEWNCGTVVFQAPSSSSATCPAGDFLFPTMESRHQAFHQRVSLGSAFACTLQIVGLGHSDYKKANDKGLQQLPFVKKKRSPAEAPGVFQRAACIHASRFASNRPEVLFTR